MARSARTVLSSVERGQEAAQVAVEDRHMTDEQQIAQPQRSARAIEDREIGVGVRGRPGAQAQASRPPRSSSSVVAIDARRQDDRAALRDFAEIPPQRIEVVRAAPPHRIGEAGMADEFGMIVGERRVAEDVIRMDMRVDDVAHRHRRNAPDRLPQRLADRKRSAGVDDRDAPGADDKAEIGNVAEIGARHLGLLPVVHVHAGRRILQREFGQFRRRPAAACDHAIAAQRQHAHAQYRTARRGTTECATAVPAHLLVPDEAGLLGAVLQFAERSNQLAPVLHVAHDASALPAIVMPLATVERSTHVL